MLKTVRWAFAWSTGVAVMVLWFLLSLSATLSSGHPEPFPWGLIAFVAAGEVLMLLIAISALRGGRATQLLAWILVLGMPLVTLLTLSLWANQCFALVTLAEIAWLAPWLRFAFGTDRGIYR